MHINPLLAPVCLQKAVGKLSWGAAHGCALLPSEEQPELQSEAFCLEECFEKYCFEQHYVAKGSLWLYEEMTPCSVLQGEEPI